MKSDVIKNVLFVTEIDSDLEQKLQEITDRNSENMFVLKQHIPSALQLHDDLMRDIILAIYQENVEEIVVVGTMAERKNPVDIQVILNKMYENEDIMERMPILDYLFQHCMPEFPSRTLSDWLEGEVCANERVNTTVEVIRNHPLVPSHVRVKGLLLNEKGEEVTRIGKAAIGV